jgi:hypothetical protein
LVFSDNDLLEMKETFHTFLFLGILCFLSCGGGGTPAAVYVCGDTHNVTTNMDLACYWKDGVKTDLGEVTHNSQARGIFVHNNDVYAVGYYSDNGHTIACYWKNGTKIDIEDNTKDSRANAVYHDGTHLYVSGLSASGGKNIAVLWVDGQVVDLGPPGVESIVNAITASSNFVYAAGMVGSKPVYFKYDVTTQLVEIVTLSSQPGELSGIVVNGLDIYASGFIADINSGDLTAAYWKNGVITTLSNLTDTSVGFGMAVHGTDIYVTGMLSNFGDEDPRPVYWKNGTTISLSTPQTNDRGPGVQIAVVDGSVYVAGLYLDGMNADPTYRIPAFWKDGVRTDLLPAGSLGSAVGMFIER